MEIKYETREDGRRYPLLGMREQPNRKLGHYGMMAKDYMQENHPDRFLELKMNGTMQAFFLQVEDEAKDKVDDLFERSMKRHPIPKDMSNPLEREAYLNDLKHRAEETVIEMFICQPR